MTPAGRIARAWILWTLAILSALALAWTGAVVFVESRIRRDLRIVRTSALPDDPTAMIEAKFRLFERGCDALPVYIAELDAEDDLYLQEVIGLIFQATFLTHEFGPGPDGTEARSSGAMTIFVEDTREIRARKVEALRAWWKERGAAAHPRWRFWSTGCGAKKPGG